MFKVSDKKTLGDTLLRIALFVDRRFWSAILGGAFVWWGVGQVARDRYLLTALGFYIPSLFLALSLVGGGALAWRRRCRWLALCAILLAIPPAYAVALRENHWSRPSTEIATNDGRTLRLLHWNISNASFGWKRVANRVQPVGADFILLSELHSRANIQPLLDALGPDYSVVRAGGMMVLARGQLSKPERIRVSRGKMYIVNWRYAETELTLLIVDLPSQLFISRDPRLRRVVEVISERHPDIIVGDFNAPRNSRRLASLPVGYAHAYDAVGWGWSATWPVVAPLWAIDQCILGGRIEPLNYDLHSTLVSDHRMQVFDFRVRGGGSDRRGR